jgi:heme-degrading monooxygenase HmoA
MPYTSGTWIVESANEEEFVVAWTELALWTREEIAPGARAILLRDRDDPSRFVSFGPWESDQEMADWRANDGFSSRIGRIQRLLERFEAHTFDTAAHVGELLP